MTLKSAQPSGFKTTNNKKGDRHAQSSLQIKH